MPDYDTRDQEGGEDDEPTPTLLLQDALHRMMMDADVQEVFGLQSIENVRTFEGASVLTRDHGVVVELGDGSEYQITIVHSRSARR